MKVEVIEVKPLQQQYARVGNVATLFDLGRTKTSELINAMEKNKPWSEYIITINERAKLVRVDAFEAYLKSIRMQ
jgi:hypothetical protein|nr:MAG TPA: hypothetical protein [Caudoviricetes sp.]